MMRQSINTVSDDAGLWKENTTCQTYPSPNIFTRA